MNDAAQLVLVLDDDASVLGSLRRLLTGRGFPVRLHADPEDLFNAGLPAVPSCLLLDHVLSAGVTGMDVYLELRRRGWMIPTIFLTAYWDVRSVVDAMRAGADGFLTKPYDPEELIAEVTKALEAARFSTDLAKRAAQLTTRERLVVEMVVTGHLNKEIANHLGLALVTVKLYRSRAMQKLGAGNAAELTRLASMIGIVSPPDTPPAAAA